MTQPLHLEAWDSSTYAFVDTQSQRTVADEARDLAEVGLRVWVVGPYVIVAGPPDVVQALDDWVAAQLRAAARRLVSGAWGPPPDVD